MKIKICPKCGKQNDENAWNCVDCGETLSINTLIDIEYLQTSQVTIEALRSATSDPDPNVANEAQKTLDILTGRIKKLQSQDSAASTLQSSKKDVPGTCSNCGTVLHPSLNHCTNCRKAYRPSRITSNNAYPKVDMRVEEFFVAKQDETLALAFPNAESERLYLMGPGDMLQIEKEKGTKEYYCLHLPGNESGFVIKKSGIIVESGLDEVKAPLGFVRQNYGKVRANIVARQSNGDDEIIGVIQEDERYPIVEEEEDNFKIQLPNKLQGWIHKAYVLRTISPTSVLVAPKSSGELADILLGVAGLIAIGVIGGISGLAGDPEENRIRRGVDKALRDRGM